MEQQHAEKQACCSCSKPCTVGARHCFKCAKPCHAVAPCSISIEGVEGYGANVICCCECCWLLDDQSAVDHHNMINTKTTQPAAGEDNSGFSAFVESGERDISGGDVQRAIIDHNNTKTPQPAADEANILPAESGKRVLKDNDQSAVDYYNLIKTETKQSIAGGDTSGISSPVEGDVHKTEDADRRAIVNLSNTKATQTTADEAASPPSIDCEGDNCWLLEDQRAVVDYGNACNTKTIAQPEADETAAGFPPSIDCEGDVSAEGDDCWLLEDQRAVVEHGNLCKLAIGTAISAFSAPIDRGENDVSEDESTPAAKKRRRVFSIKDKIDILEFAKESSVRAASRHFDVHRKTVRDWKKQEPELRKIMDSSKRRLPGGGRKLTNADFDTALAKWVKDLREKKVRVTRSMIVAQAQQLSTKYKKLDNFSGSHGWLDGFLKRHHFKATMTSSTTSAPAATASGNWKAPPQMGEAQLLEWIANALGSISKDEATDPNENESSDFSIEM